MPKISVVTMTCRPQGLEAVRNALLKQTMPADEWEWLVDINWTGKVDFNKASNRLIQRAKGELVVFVQDYVEIEPDALQKLWEAYQKVPAFFTCPVTHYDDKNERTDWRQNKIGAIGWDEWEIDFGAAPREALIATGGFDEELDKYWGYDNLSVGLRAEMQGNKFFNLPYIKARAWDHNKNVKHEFRHLQNVDFSNQRLEYIKQGILTINCLQP
jgi:hypothetical protein